MEINLLALNVGNSRLSMGAFVAGEIGEVTRIPHARRDQWAAHIGPQWDRIKLRDNAAIVAAGVNPPMQQALADAVEQAAGRRVVWVGKDLDLPIKVLTESPEQTGVDRVLNVAAAYEQIGSACVVVDAGTCVTVDVCNDQGEFLGGAIAPGVRLQLEAMHGATAQLPQVEFTPPTHPIGDSTREAMLHGVYHGVRGMVKELAENYATELGRWPEVVATGGDAEPLFTGWELIHAISPDLTLYGIALAYAEHHIKHET
jgi:type III pantothenate kinase